MNDCSEIRSDVDRLRVVPRHVWMRLFAA